MVTIEKQIDTNTLPIPDSRNVYLLCIFDKNKTAKPSKKQASQSEYFPLVDCLLRESGDKQEAKEITEWRDKQKAGHKSNQASRSLPGMSGSERTTTFKSR
ncbi:hypothetical protein AVEN_140851-1 [Araneus ventricosus]|uniref:Uncharacterized protein n=1 Tax=Araneus ventricosus TaxID=182803 RepID=A0A4Y2GL47_ARAVE|nr:hypothetical protein AVEN_265588-1 [Araneus ventricosus]GBM54319.1 hypothetical protein AVEN_46763-1 [Araneus ventricosus]GBM54323.1 hypothetical protein AVEN_48442-1 [Araneus ventricosus]GBM54447.1 hypothetical protein AVEN_140851-1 [Araneus ventricosus]